MNKNHCFVKPKKEDWTEEDWMVSRMCSQAFVSACLYGDGKSNNGLWNFKGFKK